MTKLFRHLVLQGLRSLRLGSLTVREGGLSESFGGHGREDLRATLTVTDPKAWQRMVLGGSLGAAEGYLRGEWVADDLTTVLRIFAANLDVADEMESLPSRLLNAPARLAHRLRANTQAGSRRNIRAHYDLGNDLFELFLDPTMTYSCAWFDSPQVSLEEASRAKLDRVCRKLELTPSDRVVEIGTGWGSFALHAASRYGCHVTTTTISAEQHAVAARRIEEAGLADRVTLLQQDYRTLTGTYDKLVSIEMIEAVGAEHLDTYFGTCSRLLAPHGQALIQGIVMPERRMPAYLQSTDYIQAYVFPGAALASIGTMAQAVGRATDLSFLHVEDMAPHYAMTLQRWRETFLGRLDAVRALGRYDERFIRLWEYYLAYCEAGFSERCTGVVQVVMAKPGCRRGDVRVGPAATPTNAHP
ncbi:MAG: cyclopropane-fatty-acyl-phospholipid synthase family protein [Candidatus Sericytochromatia bacterium]|nr:cyclopropane-fatty-acyl-phospholipid synthase family protein [Candidatus Sericytochromatia bacterium]